jgi:hypothetical protein
MGESMPEKPGKKKKAKPPELPKGAPKDIADFVDCKGNTVTFKAGKVDWIPKEGLGEFVPDPEVGFEEDKTKPGTFNVKVKLGVTFTLPASIKDGKLEVDTTSVPVDKIKKGIDDWVKKLNDWLEANGKKLGGAKIKDGALTVTKEAVAGEPAKQGVKAGPFPHVPVGEKVGALGVLGLSIVFGLALINAGDETETRTKKVCPESSRPGRSVGTGIRCERLRAFDEVPPPAEGFAEQIGDVYINLEGGPQSPGTLAPGSEGTLSFRMPLFAIGQPHRVEFWNAPGTVLDAFTFTVPAASGPAPPVPTDQGGSVDCLIDHQNPVPPGASGADCLYTQPAVDATPQPMPDGGDTVEPLIRKLNVTTDGAPFSLLMLPGGALLGLGGLYARDECMGAKGKGRYGGDLDTGPM